MSDLEAPKFIAKAPAPNILASPKARRGWPAPLLQKDLSPSSSPSHISGTSSKINSRSPLEGFKARVQPRGWTQSLIGTSSRSAKSESHQSQVNYQQRTKKSEASPVQSIDSEPESPSTSDTASETTVRENYSRSKGKQPRRVPESSTNPSISATGKMSEYSNRIAGITTSQGPRTSRYDPEYLQRPKGGRIRTASSEIEGRESSDSSGRESNVQAPRSGAVEDPRGSVQPFDSNALEIRGWDGASQADSYSGSPGRYSPQRGYWGESRSQYSGSPRSPQSAGVGLGALIHQPSPVPSAEDAISIDGTNYTPDPLARRPYPPQSADGREEYFRSMHEQETQYRRRRQSDPTYEENRRPERDHTSNSHSHKQGDSKASLMSKFAKVSAGLLAAGAMTLVLRTLEGSAERDSQYPRERTRRGRTEGGSSRPSRRHRSKGRQS